MARWRGWIIRAVTSMAPKSDSYEFVERAFSLRSRSDIRTHLSLAVSWLERAQTASSTGGFSAGYSLIGGRWRPAYPETTGYIIPTLLLTAAYLNDPGIRATALRAADWLVEIQDRSGFFCAIGSSKPQVFDTGQCVEGLYAAAAVTGLAKYQRACEAALDWMLDNQNPDGSWSRFIFNKRAKAYYGRVGATLLWVGRSIGHARAVEAGMRNLDWVGGQQEENGFFRQCNFDGHPTYLHTLAYATAALMRAYIVAGDIRLLHRVVLNVHGLLRALEGTQGWPAESYNSQWRPQNSSMCFSGLAQYSAILLSLAAVIPADERFGNAGRRFLDLLMRAQVRAGANVFGCIPPSEPPFRSYVGPTIVNWGIKFFMDSLLLSALLDEPTNDALRSFPEWLV